jgi:hypothetical protein
LQHAATDQLVACGMVAGQLPQPDAPMGSEPGRRQPSGVHDCAATMVPLLHSVEAGRAATEYPVSHPMEQDSPFCRVAGQHPRPPCAGGMTLHDEYTHASCVDHTPLSEHVVT